jgi:hypothetical protein
MFVGIDEHQMLEAFAHPATIVGSYALLAHPDLHG